MFTAVGDTLAAKPPCKNAENAGYGGLNRIANKRVLKCGQLGPVL